MLKRLVLFIFATLPCLSASAAGQGDCCGKQQILVPENMQLLNDIRDGYQRGDKAMVKYVNNLNAVMTGYCEQPLVYATDKKQLPPSQDRRDYMSLSTYWWPDTTKADGTPYIRRDGQRNPEVHDYSDRENINLIDRSVSSLCEMYYFTQDEKWAEGAVRIVAAWFLDRDKGMNPNMTYAQYIPGQKKQRGTGILDSRHLARAVSMCQLLEGSKAYQEIKPELTAWASAFVYWLEHSSQGHSEQNAGNNHGLWFEATHSMLLAYLGRYDDIKKVVAESIMPKLSKEIAADGSLPKELERTLSLHYSVFAMEGVNTVNMLSMPLGLNIWKMKTDNGRTLEDALRYIEPYLFNQEQWPHRQIKPFETERAVRLLYEASVALGNRHYLNEAKSVGLKHGTKVMTSLPYYNLRNK